MEPTAEAHVSRLRWIAALLRSGVAGQRDEWVAQLEAAAAEIERLREYLRLRGDDIVTLGMEIGKLKAELDRLERDPDPAASV